MAMEESEDKRLFRVLFAIVFALVMGFSVVNPFLPIYLRNITGTGVMITLVFSGYALAKIVFSPLAGRYSDLTNRRRYIFTGLALHTAIAFIFFLLPQSILVIIVLRFCQGIATALVRPIAQAYVGDMSLENHEGAVMGTFDISFYLALAIGPLVGGIIGEPLGYRGLFLVSFLLCLFALTLAIIFIWDKHGSPMTVEMAPGNNRWSVIFNTRILQGLFCYIFSRSFGLILVPIFLPLFLSSQLHIGYRGIGICLAAGSLCTALLLRPMGKLSDRTDRRQLIVIGGVLSGVTILLLPFADGLWNATFLILCLSLFSAISLPASTAILVEEGKRHGLGYTMGIFHSVMNGGFVIAPLLGGILYDLFTLQSVFYFAGMTGVTGTVIFAVYCRPRVGQKNHYTCEKSR